MTLTISQYPTTYMAQEKRESYMHYDPNNTDESTDSHDGLNSHWNTNNHNYSNHQNSNNNWRMRYYMNLKVVDKPNPSIYKSKRNTKHHSSKTSRMSSSLPHSLYPNNQTSSSLLIYDTHTPNTHNKFENTMNILNFDADTEQDEPDDQYSPYYDNDGYMYPLDENFDNSTSNTTTNTTNTTNTSTNINNRRTNTIGKTINNENDKCNENEKDDSITKQLSCIDSPMSSSQSRKLIRTNSENSSNSRINEISISSENEDGLIGGPMLPVLRNSTSTPASLGLSQATVSPSVPPRSRSGINTLLPLSQLPAIQDGINMDNIYNQNENENNIIGHSGYLTPPNENSNLLNFGMDSLPHTPSINSTNSTSNSPFNDIEDSPSCDHSIYAPPRMTRQRSHSDCSLSLQKMFGESNNVTTPQTIENNNVINQPQIGLTPDSITTTHSKNSKTTTTATSVITQQQTQQKSLFGINRKYQPVHTNKNISSNINLNPNTSHGNHNLHLHHRHHFGKRRKNKSIKKYRDPRPLGNNPRRKSTETRSQCNTDPRHQRQRHSTENLHNINHYSNETESSPSSDNIENNDSNNNDNGIYFMSEKHFHQSRSSTTVQQSAQSAQTAQFVSPISRTKSKLNKYEARRKSTTHRYIKASQRPSKLPINNENNTNSDKYQIDYNTKQKNNPKQKRLSLLGLALQKSTNNGNVRSGYLTPSNGNSVNSKSSSVFIKNDNQRNQELKPKRSKAIQIAPKNRTSRHDPDFQPTCIKNGTSFLTEKRNFLDDAFEPEETFEMDD